jgi:hypothetical protein
MINKEPHKYAILKELTGSPKVRHSVGLPSALGGHPQPLPVSAMIILQPRPDGFFLYRLSSTGQPAGDTWHSSEEDALHQAEFEFGERIGDWRTVPLTETDPYAFVIKQYKKW